MRYGTQNSVDPTVELLLLEELVEEEEDEPVLLEELLEEEEDEPVLLEELLEDCAEELLLDELDRLEELEEPEDEELASAPGTLEQLHRVRTRAAARQVRPRCKYFPL